MDKTKIFPAILIILDFGAAAMYMAHGNIRLTVYWMAAGVLTICVAL